MNVDSQSIKQIVGRVNAHGRRAASYGNFKVERIAPGRYVISFDGEFGTIYGGTVTQIHPGAHGNGGDTRDNALFATLDTKSALVITGDGQGRQTDRDFSFVVFGSNQQ